jgi:hypothetical protein
MALVLLRWDAPHAAASWLIECLLKRILFLAEWFYGQENWGNSFLIAE